MKRQNNVNSLTGSEWLRNAVNFWSFDEDDLEDIYNRFYNFCYKDRTSSGILKNIENITVNSSDFSFNHVKNIEDAKATLSVILNGAYNSYHVILLKNEIIDDFFVTPYFTRNLDMDGIEYRGKIIIKIKNGDKIFIALLFLNRRSTFEMVKPFFNPIKINYSNLVSYIIESRSKIDKIGLSHPAPYSYIDINKLVQIENINNCTILDPFLGVGSTIIGTYENNYNIGIELNQNYVDLIYKRFDFLGIPNKIRDKCSIICGDSLKEIDKIDKEVDVVITSPPYFNILKNKTSGVRTDKSQSRQGIEYYSDSSDDIGNIDSYLSYLSVMAELFKKIKSKMSSNGKFYLIISDFTVNKKEKDIHSDFIEVLNKCGFTYTGTSYILQNQKAIYPFGYPYKLVINHIYQYILKFEVINNEHQ